mgnify:CR=1 FL=1
MTNEMCPKCGSVIGTEVIEKEPPRPMPRKITFAGREFRVVSKTIKCRECGYNVNEEREWIGHA